MQSAMRELRTTPQSFNVKQGLSATGGMEQQCACQSVESAAMTAGVVYCLLFIANNRGSKGVLLIIHMNTPYQRVAFNSHRTQFLDL